MARRFRKLVSFLRERELGVREQRPYAAPPGEHKRPSYQGERSQVPLGLLRTSSCRPSGTFRSWSLKRVSRDAFAPTSRSVVTAESLAANYSKRIIIMAFVTTRDGVEIFYKDWGPKDARPIVFHHGWPLSSDDWDNQMLFFVNNGYRVVAHDRRGHGRSSQVSGGHDMTQY